MRVLVATPSLPLPFGTADARWLHVVVTGLAARGHDVVCVSCTQNGVEEIEAAVDLLESSGVRLRHVPLALSDASVVTRKVHSARRPFSEYERIPELRRALSEESGAADVVHLEHLFASRMGLHLPNAVTFLHHLEVIDEEHRVGLDLRERIVRRQMARATRQVLAGSRRVMAATARVEKRALEIAPHLDTVVVPVSIDVGLYPTSPLPADPVVGVIGSMHWFPSRSAAERVLTTLWPAIHGVVPQARLLVAGWGSEEHLGRHFPMAGAELLGTVGDPRDFFDQISVLLYPPQRGSGFKIKVLEAMAYGRVVVTNADGIEGLVDRGEPTPLVARTDDEFIQTTVDVLRDPTRMTALAGRGRAEVENIYSPGPATDRLLEAYSRLGLGVARERSTT